MMPQARDAEQPLTASPPSDAVETDAAQGSSAPVTSSSPPGNASASTAETQPTTIYLQGNLGDYELLEELAWGGMGVVYKARHKRLGRIVALKAMRRDVAEDHDLCQRFEREMRAAARLQHRNIVPIYEVNKDNGRLFYTMPFVSGGSLSKHRQRFQQPAKAAALVEKIARAVHHAHEQGILHRDLKPGNILLDEGDEPMVADFGLAKLDDADPLTHTGQVLGTFGYMAPEQAAGHSQKTIPATDVWALGVILYELVTGQRPFVGEGRDEVQRLVLEDNPLRPTELVTGLDPRLEAIIMVCLRKSSTERYQTAGALADQLVVYGRGEDVVEPLFAHRPLLYRRGWPIAASLAGLLFLLALVAIRFTPRGSDKDETTVLIGDGDKPPALRWLAGQANVDEQRFESGLGLFLSTRKACYAELMPAVLHDDFRFQADVRHMDWQPYGTVGIYYAHQAAEGGASTFHNLYVLRIKHIPDDSYTSVENWWFNEKKPEEMTFFAFGNRLRLMGPHTKFHRLTIEVQGGQATFSVNDEFTETYSAEKLQAVNVQAKIQDPPLVVNYAPHGGLGVYVDQGAAYFRNATFKPLRRKQKETP